MFSFKAGLKKKLCQKVYCHFGSFFFNLLIVTGKWNPDSLSKNWTLDFFNLTSFLKTAEFLSKVAVNDPSKLSGLL